MASATQTNPFGASVQQDQDQNQATVSLETAQAHFEAGVAYTLNLWPALTLAVSNNWGGPNSADKRDWFAGAVVDLFSSHPETDLEDVETVLLQVMLDEFEVAVDDESAFETAETVMRLRAACGRGLFAEVEQLRQRWVARGGRGEVGFQKVETGDDDQDTDGDSVDEESDSGDEEMGDAPPAPRQRAEPEVDEDGFTTVPNRRKR